MGIEKYIFRELKNLMGNGAKKKGNKVTTPFLKNERH